MENETVLPQENSLTLRDYIQVLFRQKVVVLVCLVTVIATAYVGLKLQTKYYQASVKMLITAQKQVEAPYYKESDVSRSAEQTLTQSELVKSNPVLMRVVLAQALHKRPPQEEKQFVSPLKQRMIDFQIKARESGLARIPPEQRDQYLIRGAIETLRASIKVEPIRDTNMFTISVRDYNPIGAAIIANTVSRSYVIFDLEQQLSELRLKYGEGHPKVAYVRDNIAAMEKTLHGQPIDDMQAIGPASVKVMEQAMVPIAPVGTSKKTTFILAIIMGMFLGVMLAFIFEYADQTVRSPRDIEQILGIPCVGSIRGKRWFQPLIADYRKRLNAYARSYQLVCDQLYLIWKEKNVQTVLITATLKREDTRAVASNMAAYLATKLNSRVLIIDANFRSPGVYKAWKVSNKKGLVDYLLGKAELQDVTQTVSERLSVIPAGTAAINPILLYQSEKMKELLVSVRKEFNLIIIRSSSLRHHKEAGILARVADAVLVVIDSERVRRQVMQTAFADLKSLPHQNWGAMLINRKYYLPQWIYEAL